MNRNIPVVILCGGMGTRMKEETEYIPKPLVEVGGIPLLVHVMNIYHSYGFNQFVLPLGYKGIKIKEYFLNYKYHNDLEMTGSTFRIVEDKLNKFNINFIETGLRTETGSRIKRVSKYLNGDTFMLTYGDGLSDVNIDKLLEFHFSHGKSVTITGVNEPPRFGVIEDDNGLVTSFCEKKQTYKNIVNCGFFVLNKKFLDYIGDGDDIKLEFSPISKAVENRDVMVYRHGGRWACGDYLREIEDLNNMYAKGEAFWIR